MASVGACLLANEPEGLGAKMIQRRIDGKSWKEIADEFQLGSPSTARAQFKKLTGINDFKSKGSALKQIVNNLDNLKSGETKVAAQAIKNVDTAVQDKVVVKEIANSKQALEDVRSAVDSMYGPGKAEEVLEDLKKGHGYLNVAQKTGVDLKDIDQLNWRQLMVQHDGDVWKAYLEKPSSENGFSAVKKMVNEARADGNSIKAIASHTDIPESVVNAITKDQWKIAQAGAKAPVIPPAPPPPAQVVSMSEPIKAGKNYQYRGRHEYNDWDNQLGSDLLQTELRAVRGYTGSYYREINHSLRQAGATTHQYVGPLDRAMRPIPFDTIVTRKVDANAFRSMGIFDPSDLVNQVGKVFVDKGYLSSSILEGGNWSGNVTMKIHVPKGTPARWVDNGLTSCRGENEMIIGRGQKLLIREVQVQPGAISKANAKVTLICEII